MGKKDSKRRCDQSDKSPVDDAVHVTWTKQYWSLAKFACTTNNYTYDTKTKNTQHDLQFDWFGFKFNNST